MNEPQHPKYDLLSKGLRPKKSFGQNFLVDEVDLSAIAGAAYAFGENDSLIVEFGAGLGALTERLLKYGVKIHAIERDRDLVPILLEHFKEQCENNTLIIHEDDAVKFDFCGLAASAGKKVTLCGNLPYHLTSTLVMRAVESYEDLRGAVFLVQKEVADRILAKPHCKDYGILSVFVQSRFRVRRVRDVPRDAFWPVPKVDSTVIALTPKFKLEQPSMNWEKFKFVVKAAFNQRRKTLRNSLSSIENIDDILEELDIDSQLRAENLSVGDFVKLAQKCAQ